MTFNPNKYRRTLDSLKHLIIKGEDKLRTCSELAVAYHVPILAVFLYALRPDVLGYDEYMNSLVGRLMVFYKHNHVEQWTD